MLWAMSSQNLLLGRRSRTAEANGRAADRGVVAVAYGRNRQRLGVAYKLLLSVQFGKRYGSPRFVPAFCCRYTPMNSDMPIMPLGKVVYESGGILRHVYFPTDCIVSLLYVMENGASAEISVVGHEGMIGISLFSGAKDPGRALVQSAGYAYRLPGELFKQEFNRHVGKCCT